MVCLLHTLGQGGILASCAEGSVQYYIFWFLEISSYCAVNGFAIISGYTAVERPQKYSKLINMWFQAFFYSFIVTVILALFGFAEGMGTEQYVRMALPLTHNMFWYFTAYFALFLVTPLLHKVMELFDEKGSRKALLVLILVFSCVNFRHNAFASGYSAMWVMILYCVGALAKKGRLFERKKSYALILTFALCVILSWGGQGVFQDRLVRQLHLSDDRFVRSCVGDTVFEIPSERNRHQKINSPFVWCLSVPAELCDMDVYPERGFRLYCRYERSFRYSLCDRALFGDLSFGLARGIDQNTACKAVKDPRTVRKACHLDRSAFDQILKAVGITTVDLHRRETNGENK